MFNKEDFKRQGYQLIDWIAEYFDGVEKFPVRPALKYGAIRKDLPVDPPDDPESFDTIFQDFRDKLLPGITHWQSPKFFAYFPANNSVPSVQAEFLTAALGVQGMKWVTSPAATELEEVVMDWLRNMTGLSANFKGVILDTASVSTLCAILTARERYTGREANQKGLKNYVCRVYCSSEAHSSVEKAVRIAGIGSENLVKIPVDEQCRMVAADLEEAVYKDKKKGYVPTCIVAALGTTGTCSFDPIDKIAAIASESNVWLHVDAAFAGTALILPEFRKLFRKLSEADSLVFNPHKWMFTNFDCSAFFVKNPDELQDTFRLVPAYLQTQNNNEANDYSNWGIHLGRRFRALKLWFVIRHYGLKGLQQMIRQHIYYADYFADQIAATGLFELVIPKSLAVVSFRLSPKERYNPDQINELNKQLLEDINDRGNIYLSHTMVGKKFTLRFVCAQTNIEMRHVEEALHEIEFCAQHLLNSH